ncbi:MAG: LytTR family DNA-binding domain-containing protein [Muribaculaceae bacterium]|nr:LytTR family DNA-binding domain-containing protein [Muribaculaceae bacterium]
MKIALVDDEWACLDEMSGLIDEFGIQHGCQIDAVPFQSAEAFLGAFENGGFSAVFMDIYMDDMDGVAAAVKMQGVKRDTPLVFLTSSEDFMPDAFSLHAFEYVIKPIARDRIFKVLSDLLERLPAPRKYIEVADGKKNVRIFLDDIASAVTDAHYLDISLMDGEKLRCRMTMAEFMRLTGDDRRFLAINKGIAVNAEYITGFENGCCVLENDAKLPVRVRDRAAVEQAARDYNFEKIRGRQTHFAGHSAPADLTGRSVPSGRRKGE